MTTLSDSSLGLLGRDRRRGTVYPSPFFDIAQTYMPPTVKELFRWCAYFFYKDPMIGAVVTKIAEYPVTDFVYNADDKHVRDAWKRVIEDELNLKPFLIEIGLDHFCYGNAFVSINLPFVRWIKCPQCADMHRLADTDFSYTFKNFDFHFHCKPCGKDVCGQIVDRPIRDRTGINFVRWDPRNIDIHYNPLTGRSKYRYKIPNKTKLAIRQGIREILVDTPAVYFEALKKNRDIALADQNIFHFKRPTLAEQDMGWGKPLILHSMGRMFYLYVLRRAQEAIALQRILPLEFIFPQANGAQDPYQHVNLGNWSLTMQEEIRRWRVDPNYISVVSVPLGFERLGGDGRALLLGPEIEVTNKEITGGMGVPIEFVFGGLSWSGSSVSLRTLENHFLMYRRLLLRFINWAKNRIRLYLGYPDVEIGFTEFKMADDIQRKQIVIQLNAANKISDHTMLTELGFDYDDELEMIEKEADQRNRISALTMKAQAEAQGEAQIIAAKYQVRSQEAFAEAQGTSSLGQPGMEGQAQNDVAAQNQGGAPGAPQSGMPAQQPGAQPQPGAPPGAAAPAPDGTQNLAMDQQMAQQANQQMASQQAGPVAGQAGDQSGAAAPPPGGEQNNVVQLDAAKVAQNWANKIAKMDFAQRTQVLNELRAKMPNMARIVEQILSQIGPGETAGAAAEKAKPLPQAAPPVRQQGPI